MDQEVPVECDLNQVMTQEGIHIKHKCCVVSRILVEANPQLVLVAQSQNGSRTGPT